jgi:hypothetical protein
MDFSGLFSSMAASFIVYPIDVVKSQYQVTSRQTIRPKPAQLISNIYKTQGIYGFYKGVSSNLMTYPIFWTVYFSVRDVKLQPTSNKYLNSAASSMIGATLGSIIANPLFVLKVRKQTELLRNINVSYTELSKKIIKNEGILGFTKGVNATIFSNTKLILQFPMYDFFKDQTSNVIVSSLLSKVITSTIYYPMDLIRTIQRDAPEKISSYTLIKDLLKQGKLYRGCGLYVMLTTPNFVLMMYFKELFDKSIIKI